jgi:hypothetical protein
MARRDGPDDHSVCEHNVDLTVTEAACPTVVRRTAEIRTGDDHRWPSRVRYRRRGATLARAFTTAE